MDFNHNRDVSEFQKNIEKLRKSGFKPIAVSQIVMEDVFVFESKEEATRAYQMFEKKLGVIMAWWYGKEDFLKEIELHESKCKEINLLSKVLVHWLT